MPLLSDPQLASEVEEIAGRIAGEGGTLDLARRIAEAQVDLNRVRAVRSALLSLEPADSRDASTAQRQHQADRLRKLLAREERPVEPDWIDCMDQWRETLPFELNFSFLEKGQALRGAMRDAQKEALARMRAALANTEAVPELPANRSEREARRLSELTKELETLERYERRALSRRKFAIRAFDAASQQRCRPENSP